MLPIQRLTSTAAITLSHKGPLLQRWIRTTSNSQKVESVTIDFESLNKTTQSALKELKRWDHAFNTSSLLAAYSWTVTLLSTSSDVFFFSLTAGAICVTSLYPLSIITDNKSQDLEHDAMTSLSSLSTNTEAQAKINNLVRSASYISATLSSSKITITPVAEISRDQIIIPSPMLQSRNRPLREIVANVKNPEEAIHKLVFPKHLQGAENPLKAWAKTSHLSIARDNKGNLFLNKTFAPWIKSIRESNWEGSVTIPPKN